MKNAPLRLALLLAMLGAATAAPACTNLLVTKGASEDGSTMLTYSADSYQMFGELYHYPAAKYRPGTMLDVYEWDAPGHLLGQIPQVRQTYNVIGNMNEKQVAITETTFGGRPELCRPNGILDYGSLIYITLQRAASAREAIEIMTSLVAEYGYYSEGESFSIADPDEVWIMELIGKGEKEKGAVWVARRVPDGYICAHANQARITTFPLDDPQNCLYSPDVISFARKMGYFSGEDADFDFSAAYCPLDFTQLRFCGARVWSIFQRSCAGFGDRYLRYAMGDATAERMPLWIKPDRKLSVLDAMELMRDHYENTPMDIRGTVMAGAYDSPYGTRPLDWELDSVAYFCERPISTPQTAFSLVSQSRGWLPDEIGGILWFGLDDTYFTCYTPIYASSTRVAECFAVGNGDFNTYSPTAAFWIFNRLAQQAYAKYAYYAPEIRARQAELERDYLRVYVKAGDERALKLYKSSPKRAVACLTDFSIFLSEKTVAEWKDLEAFLLVKYFDGVIHPEKDGDFLRSRYGGPGPIETPGWSKPWREKIVKDAPERFKVPTED